VERGVELKPAVLADLQCVFHNPSCKDCPWQPTAFGQTVDQTHPLVLGGQQVPLVGLWRVVELRVVVAEDVQHAAHVAEAERHVDFESDGAAA
jgi:hypothetical protein